MHPAGLVDTQLKDIGPGVVTYRIEVEPGTGDLAKVDVSRQDRLAAEIRAGQDLPERPDDTALAEIGKAVRTV